MKKKMIKENYECDGQMDIFDFLDNPRDGTIKIGNEVLFVSDGWHEIEYIGNGCRGEYPECKEWRKIEIWSYIKEFNKYVHGWDEGKEWTIRRNPGGDIGEVVAWRYV